MSSTNISRIFNTRTHGNAQKKDVKAFLKFFFDDEIDSTIDEAFQVGSALFGIATHVIVARNLIRNTEKYAQRFSPAFPNEQQKIFRTKLEEPKGHDVLVLRSFNDGSVYGSEILQQKKWFAEIDSEETTKRRHEKLFQILVKRRTKKK